tara:strand:- start:991 stop:1818 length:828 start_codon:yes stop_codon:yes gene_type:complete
MNLKKIKQEKTVSELLEFCIINVDKPAGCTSFDVVEKIKNIFGARKCGHFGTLDPMVTGVLPIAVNRAVKLTNYFMHKDKIYVGKFRIHKEIDEDELRREMEKFVGKIMQKPPVKSAVKRQLRQRTVYKFEIIKKHAKIIEFIADVEAGTYIRKLISDLGEKIGGAHMTELRRIKAGIFDIKDSIRLEDLEKIKDNKEKLIPAEIISEILPVVQIKKQNLKQILTGKPLMKNDFEKLPEDELFSVFIDDKFIEIAKKVSEKEKPEIIARPEFVLN